MQDFLQTKYYIECRTHEEIVEFFQMCEEAGLRMRDRSRPTELYADRYGEYATFAYNYRGKDDGISSWSTLPSHSDFKKPHVLFTDFLKNNQPDSQCNVSDILDLL